MKEVTLRRQRSRPAGARNVSLGRLPGRRCSLHAPGRPEELPDHVLGAVGPPLGRQSGEGTGDIVAEREKGRLTVAARCWGKPTAAGRPLHRHMRPTVSLASPRFARESSTGSLGER